LASIFTSEYRNSRNKVIIVAVIELAVRYATFFDTPAHTEILTYVINMIIAGLTNPDVYNNVIYNFNRLAMKISAQLTPYIQSTLPIAMQILPTLSDESADHIVKTYGLILQSRGIDETSASFIM